MAARRKPSFAVAAIVGRRSDGDRRGREEHLLVARQVARCCPVLLALWLAFVPPARAGGGPLGIDQRWNFDDSGVWKRRNQTLLQRATLLAVAGGALWEGDDSRLGRTLWQSVDSIALGTIAAAAMKPAFARTRPRVSEDPDLWFQGRGNNSFPSNEVLQITAAVTPFVLEYGAEHPAVWALELLPAFVAVGRVKQRAHWQSDVLASFALGTGLGVYAHSRTSAISVGLLPRGFTIGWKKSF